MRLKETNPRDLDARPPPPIVFVRSGGFLLPIFPDLLQVGGSEGGRHSVTVDSVSMNA